MIKSNEGEEDEDWASVNVMVTGEYQKVLIYTGWMKMKYLIKSTTSLIII